MVRINAKGLKSLPDSSIKFNILDLARDFLFLEDVDFYPSELWTDFQEALYLFLTEDEIEALNYRYGNVDESRFSVDETRRILSGLMFRFIGSEFYEEMNSIMTGLESAEQLVTHVRELTPLQRKEIAIVIGALEKIGIDYSPGAAGRFEYDAMISRFPVYVWRESDTPVPLRILKRMLEDAAEEGFGRFFMVANPRLTVDLPRAVEGCIPHTFIPLIDETFETDRSKQKDRQLTI